MKVVPKAPHELGVQELVQRIENSPPTTVK